MRSELSKVLLRASTIILILGFVTACATTPLTLTDAVQAPSERVLAFQTPRDYDGTLVVIRDEGFVLSGCFLALYINRTLAARLDVREVATFYVDPGEVLLRVAGDPEGQGLCGLGTDRWTQRETFLKRAETKHFRLTIDVNGQLDIQRSDQ
jgi:hypothetical protein